MSNEIKIEDSSKRVFSTGAKRQASAGKGTPVLVPGDAIIDVAKHFEKGVEVYEERNWEKGIPLSKILNSLERHLQAEKMGLTDEPHARALVWNALVYLATKLRIENGLLPTELNDMPVYTKVSPEKIKATAEVMKTNDDTLEEVIAINEEMAKEFGKEPIKDTMRSEVRNDGKWYCSGQQDCMKRGFSNLRPNTFICDEHIDKQREKHESFSK